MKHPLPTRLVTGLMILLMGLFPLAQTAATAPSPCPAVATAIGTHAPAAPSSPLRFYFGAGAAPVESSPATARVGDWAATRPAASRILAQDGGLAPGPAAPAPAKPVKAKSEPHVSWFETREGKITSGIIIAGIIVGAVVYAACQGNVVIVSDGGIRVQNKRR